MIYVDQAEEEISSTLNPNLFAKISRRVTAELDYRLARAVFNDYTSKSPLAPEEAFTMLSRACLWLEAYLLNLASGYSPLRWLWMMRRIPHHVFSELLPTTFGYDQALAEVLTARSQMAESRIEIQKDGRCSYSIFGATIRRLAEFCAAARYLSSLHASLRWAGKGSRFALKRDGRPVLISDPAVEAAVGLYDKRGSCGAAAPLHRSGTILGIPDSQEGPSILYLNRIEPQFLSVPINYIPTEISGTSPGDEVSVLCRFVPRSVSLEPFTRLLQTTGGSTIWPREAMILILLLWGAWRMILRHKAGFLSTMTRGYLLLDKDLIEYLYEPVLANYETYFGKLFRDNNPPASADSFLTELSDISGCSWPLRPGPVMRRESQITCVDLLAAGECLDNVLEAPISDGVIPNIRGQHFELLTQELIDRSSWKPTSEIGDLRGRTLRIGGTPVTDIDAIGERNDELLAVSCKSIIYSGKYDSGDFRTVRNAVSAVINAVREWQEKMSLLQSVKRGDNFNLSKFATIIPVVCTPADVYVPIGLATANVRPELRAATSVGELAAWLHGEQ